MHAAARSLESAGGDHLCPGKPWRGVGAPPETVRFTAAGLLHRETVLALFLCGVSMVTLVTAVIGANIRKPRRRPDDPKLL
jgi:hypothetical protein